MAPNNSVSKPTRPAASQDVVQANSCSASRLPREDFYEAPASPSDLSDADTVVSDDQTSVAQCVPDVSSPLQGPATVRSIHPSCPSMYAAPRMQTLLIGSEQRVYLTGGQMLEPDVDKL